MKTFIVTSKNIRISKSIKTCEDLDDTPDSIVIEGIKQGLKEAMSGQTIPLSQM